MSDTGGRAAKKSCGLGREGETNPPERRGKDDEKRGDNMEGEKAL